MLCALHSDLNHTLRFVRRTLQVVIITTGRDSVDTRSETHMTFVSRSVVSHVWGGNGDVYSIKAVEPGGLMRVHRLLMVVSPMGNPSLLRVG